MSDIGCLCVLVGTFGTLEFLVNVAILLEVKRRGK